MIIARSPLRISLGGGGTDLSSYYEKFEGFLMAAAIDKYVYVTLHRIFRPGYIIKYSQMETVEKIAEIKHPIIRECLNIVDYNEGRLEITSMADIPAGTGLGSSSSFTTALLKALHTYQKKFLHPRDLAEQACTVEIEKVKSPIGKQDQYIAAFGGLTCFKFNKNGYVDAQPLNLKKEILYELEDNLLLFFTGYSREASSILEEQKTRSLKNDKEMIENLHFVKEIGVQCQRALESGDLEKFGKLMNQHWEYKKCRSNNMSNERINHWYNVALKNGATGGKLIGAGGGGFLMFHAHDTKKLRAAMHQEGLEEVRFRFDFDGTQIIIQ
ncbi:MAG: galactokinase [Oligoflexia bacterium]|nr:galactokinase [Oligoflexia bacterium]